MKIVFLCPTGTYSSLVAAYLYLEKIDKSTTIQEILNLPNFSKQQKIGISYYIGQDKKENKIFTLSVANESKLIIKSAEDLIKLFNKKSDVEYIDVSNFVPNYYIWCSAILPKRLIAKKIIDSLDDIDNLIKKHISFNGG